MKRFSKQRTTINSLNYIEIEAWVVIEQGGTKCIVSVVDTISPQDLITETGNSHLIQTLFHSINILVSGLIRFNVLDYNHAWFELKGCTKPVSFTLQSYKHLECNQRTLQVHDNTKINILRTQLHQ